MRRSFKEKYLDEYLDICGSKVGWKKILSNWRDINNTWRFTQYILVSHDKKSIASYFESGELIFISDSLDTFFIPTSSQSIQYQFKARLRGTRRHYWFIATKHCLIKYILNDEQRLLFELDELGKK